MAFARKFLFLRGCSGSWESRLWAGYWENQVVRSGFGFQGSISGSFSCYIFSSTPTTFPLLSCCEGFTEAQLILVPYLALQSCEPKQTWLLFWLLSHRYRRSHSNHHIYFLHYVAGNWLRQEYFPLFFSYPWAWLPIVYFSEMSPEPHRFVSPLIFLKIDSSY